MVDDVGSLVFGEFVPKQRMSPREGQTCKFYVFVQAVFSAGGFFKIFFLALVACVGLVRPWIFLHTRLLVLLPGCFLLGTAAEFFCVGQVGHCRC